MPVLTINHSGTIYREGGTTTSYARLDLPWSGLPQDVTIKQCYWKFDVRRQKGSTYARWYENNNGANSGHVGVDTAGVTFPVTNVTGTSGTAMIFFGSQNGYTNYTNVSFNIEYAYKQSSLTLSASSVEAGKAITATIAAQSSTATHKLVWKLGSNSQTQNLAAGVTSSTFTVPLAWLPSATSSVATCTLTTLQDGVQVGETQTISFTVTVNAAVIPSCTVKAELVNGFSDLYLGGRSSVKLTIQNAKAGDGASIKSYKLSGGGYSSTAQTATFGPLNAGAHTFTATVTDSRGRTGTSTVSVTVQAYAAPTLSGISIYRSDSGGTASESGGYIALRATAAYTALDGANALTLRGRYRPVGGAWSGWTVMTSGTRLLLGGGSLSSTASYEAQIQATDTVGNTASYAAIIPTASVTFNLKAGGKGAAFGKYAEGNGLELAADWGFHRDGRSLTPAPRNLLDNGDFIHPVNQRGQTSYTTSGYNVDRWRTYSAATVTVTETGLVVDATSVQANLQQNMASLPNGTFTFAAKVNGNIVYRVISNSNGTVTTVDNSKAAFTGGYLGAGKGSSAYYVHIVNSVGYVNTVEWATLYEGSYTVDTLPEYVPKGYGAELAECRRYFRTWKTTSLYQNVFSGFVTGSGKIAAVNVGPGGMRITPTVTLSNGGIIIRSGAGYSTDASNDAPCATPVVEAFDSGEQLNLTFKKSDDTAWAGVTNNTLISINLPRGTVLTASADL